MPLPVLADVKDYLHMSSVDTARDARLQHILDAATSMVTYIVGPLTPTSYAEVHDGGYQFIMLRRTPVQIISSIVEYVGRVPYPLTLQPLGSSVDNWGFSLSPATGKVTRRDAAGLPARFAGGLESVSVTYLAGQSTVDPVVYTAVLEDVRGLWSQSQNGAQPTPGGDAAADNEWAPSGMFPRLEAILSRFNRLPGIG